MDPQRDNGTAAMTADEILGTPLNDPMTLLGADADAIAKAFRRIATEWHPDHSSHPRATEVLQHLTALRSAAMRRLGAGPSIPAATRELTTADGRKLRMRVLRSSACETGEILVGPSSVAWIFDGEFSDIAEAEAAAVRGLSFKDDRIRKEMSRFLPIPAKDAALEGGRRLLAYRRTADQMLLSDLVAHLGRVPAEHVAWIVSGLENVACYLSVAGIGHGAVSPENVLVSPEHHSIALTGGWGFSARLGAERLAVPGRTASALPAAALPGAVAEAATDLDLVRLVGRECLGDPLGGRILSDGQTPASVARWLVLPAGADAFKDYESWGEALRAAWGPRRFVPMGTRPADAYASA